MKYQKILSHLLLFALTSAGLAIGQETVKDKKIYEYAKQAIVNEKWETATEKL